MYQAKTQPPKNAIRFWEQLLKYGNADPDRGGVRGIEKQLYSTSLSTGADYRDLCQETFAICAMKFGKYRSGKSALNTWIRWQARMAALRLTRQGTKHIIVGGKQLDTRMEVPVAPDTFSGDLLTEGNDSNNKSPYQEEIDNALLKSYDESDMDNAVLLDTDVYNGHTLREMGEVFVEHGRTRGINIVAERWGCTTNKILDIIAKAQDGISTY